MDTILSPPALVTLAILKYGHAALPSTCLLSVVLKIHLLEGSKPCTLCHNWLTYVLFISYHPNRSFFVCTWHTYCTFVGEWKISECDTHSLTPKHSCFLANAKGECLGVLLNNFVLVVFICHCYLLHSKIQPIYIHNNVQL